ncbi:MAG: TIR domain-containing protein [Planctomycetota bacterium]|nr:TIR domain-containing protein [Planctomycetota bacterium]
MSDEFAYDVFLSHSAKDKAVVRPLAERLRQDGLTVWFDEWEIKPGDSIPAKIEAGLEHSRVLVLCMSAQAFGSDWAQLEAGTFRFRDPLNKERRFIPLRLDDAPIKGSLAQFLYINWRPADREQEYAKLLEACRPVAEPPAAERQRARELAAEKVIQLDYRNASVNVYVFSPDRTLALTGADDKTVRLWNAETGRCLCVFEGHTSGVKCLAWGADRRLVLSGSKDGTARLWDVATGRCLCVLEGHRGWITGLALGGDYDGVLTASSDNNLRLWNLQTGRCLRVFEGHTMNVWSVAWSADKRLAISGANDGTVRLWDVKTGRCLRVLEGHTGCVWRVAWSVDQRRAISVSNDTTARFWDVETGRCLCVLKGHTLPVWNVAVGSDCRRILTGSRDHTVRLWDVETGRCLRVLEGQTTLDGSLGWSADQRRVLCGDKNGGIHMWDLSEFASGGRSLEVPAPIAPAQVQYTNAKVLLVGESGVGKTGLSKRLALDDWEPSDSTVGAWATRWKLPVSSDAGVEREIWLWDFGGQADQRLIHQLYMDETALAVLVFDGQKEDLFEMLAQWDRDLTRASRKEFAKLLVAGRADAGGLRVSRGELEAFAKEHKFLRFLETSAKTATGCGELKQAILDGIKWDEIPCRTTELFFKRLKEEIVRLKDEGRVLMRFNELRETLQLRLTSRTDTPVPSDQETGKNSRPTGDRFTDEELRAVLTLLAGPGVVWVLEFGSWVLLQPERINAYAQAVIQTLQADEYQRGCLPEEQVLKGDLKYHSAMPRLEGDEERFVLLAMHQKLVERGLCLRQPTDRGNLLIFPSYFRRIRPEQVSFPAVLVSYRFTGFLDEIYATLVVRLHHTGPFEHDRLWRYAADFKTNLGRQLGVKLTRRAPGLGELEVYFDPAVAMEERIIFSKYVHEHLLQHARDVERLRHYVCPHCGTPVGNREVAMKRLDAWLYDRPASEDIGTELKLRKAKVEPPTILCAECERRVPLWDGLEQCFASPEIQQRVRDLQTESAIVLDNESKERALVGEVISTVALAGQISREKNVSDQGIDMEIEFKDDANEATGQMLFLQLKSGDSYLRERKSDGAEIFTIKNERHARYWMAQAFPLLLVIRNSEGEVRWMEVRDWLKRASDGGKKPVKQIIFEGERFDVMSVRRWRERVLAAKSPQ